MQKQFIEVAIESEQFKPHRTLARLRYNARVQEILKSNVKAEPWMHIAIFGIPEDADKTKYTYYYCIYIWDTRHILGEGTCTAKQDDEIHAATTYCKDNGAYLRGNSEGAQRFNLSMSKVPERFRAKSQNRRPLKKRES